MANISGTSGNDRIRTLAAGGSSAGVLNASALGGDIIFAGEGADTIEPGSGWNLVFAQQGDDRVTVIGTGIVYGEDGNDSITGLTSLYINFNGDGGNDSLIAGSGGSLLNGGAGNDVLTGGIGSDEIYGGFGTDQIFGGSGDDALYGGTNSDTISGGIGNDLVDGGDGADSLNGEAGQDTMLGSGGNDTILGSRGFDRIDGGADFDILDYSNAGVARVVVSVPQGRVVKHLQGGGTELDLVQNIEQFIGTAGNDKFTGWGQDETFTGGAGNDTIDGGAGFDTVRYDVSGVGNVNANMVTGIVFDGLGGRDVLTKSGMRNSSVEMIIAGGGTDTLIGDDDDNWLRGNLGADSLDGGLGFDYADWSGDLDVNGDGFGVIVNLGSTAQTLASFGSDSPPGGLTVAGGRARDTSGATDTLVSIESARGSAMRDLLIGSDIDNTFRAMFGADTVNGGLGFDVVSHRSDADANSDGFGVIVNLSSTVVTLPSWGAEAPPVGGIVMAAQTARDGWGGIDVLVSIEGATGTFGNDLLIATTRTVNFTVNGLNFYGESRSFLRGLAGTDTLRGITGFDGATADYREDIAGVTVRLDLGTAEDGWGNIDTLINVTGAQGSLFDDLIVAASGGSYMRGRAGDDTLQGGTGIDNANYNSAPSAVQVNLVTGYAQDGEGGIDSLSGVENISGSAYADSLVGDAGANQIFGGRDADTIDGGDGQDMVSYYAAWEGLAPVNVWHNGVSVNLATGSARDGDGTPNGGSLDTLLNIEHVLGSVGADKLVGNTLANTLVGAEGDDSLSGSGGTDTLVGGEGADTLEGGSGADVLQGGAGNDYYLWTSGDTVTELVGEGLDTIEAASSFSLANGVMVEVVRLGGTAGNSLGGNGDANVLTGNTGANRLSGGGGADSLSGGGGTDTLAGEGGADRVEGGTGARDVFVFDRLSDSYRAAIDTIADFEAGLDDIQLSSVAGRFSDVAATSIAFRGVLTVASAGLGTGNSLYAAVMSGINTAAGGKASVTASADAIQAWQVNVTAGTAAGTYLFVNDGVAGAASSTDMLVRLAFASGTALTAGDLILG